MDVFSINGDTYAAVTALADNGIQVVNLTDPANPVAAGHLADTGSTLLAGASGVDVFSMHGNTYAAVTASYDDGIQIVDVTAPDTPLPVGMIDGDAALHWTSGIAIFERDNRNYALATGFTSDQLHLIDMTNPYIPVTIAELSDDATRALGNPRDLATFENDGRTYAIIAALTDNGVQIVELTISGSSN